uniref:Flavor peptide n=1 Tax=Takifugu obscurus TaxID=309541 RepID=FP_TAKOB|nr:RecName: Full=Flavor peptide; Short=PFFP [Takifugu obscurus]
YGGTPPFV